MNTDDQVDKLVTENVKLAQFMAGKQMDIDSDEAFSLALQGLHIAAQEFDESRGVPFGSYAAQRIKWTLGRHRLYRDRKKRGGGVITVSLQSEIGEDGSELSELIADEKADPLRQYFITDDSVLFKKAMRRLTQRESYIINCRFGIGDARQTLEDVGEVLGLTRERIRQIEEKALLKLRAFIEKAPRVRTREDKQKKKESNAAWYQRNKKRINEKAARTYRLYSAIIKARARKWYTENHARALKFAANYRAMQREALAHAQLQRYHHRYKDDPAFKARRAAYRERNRKRQRQYARNRSSTMTDGYIKELLHKQTGRSTFTFSGIEIDEYRNRVIARRNNPNCPFCGTKSAKSGRYGGRQRYICFKGCNRVFFLEGQAIET